jgi:hypothetical protein
VKPALQLLNKMLQADPLPEATYQAWRDELDAQRTKFPMQYPDREDVIAPQHAVEVSWGCNRVGGGGWSCTAYRAWPFEIAVQAVQCSVVLVK